MPRRHKLTRQNLDFTIHEDDNGAGMDIRDFAAEPSGMQPETPASEIKTPSLHNEATDSSMTKASTLVNEDVEPAHEDEKSKDGLEERLDSMLEELKGEIRGAEALVGGKDVLEKERRSSVDSWDVGGEDEGSQSRRESMLTTDAPTEESASRRVSTATHDDTEASASRRESALSSASWQSDRRRSEHAEESIISHEADDSFQGDSFYGDNEESLLDDGTQASRRSSNHDENSMLDDGQSSRRTSAADGRRRASERTEALIQAAARGIVEQISRSGQSSRAGEREEAGASAAVSNIGDKSARTSAAHESVVAAEEESQSKVPSARVSEAHESLAGEGDQQPKPMQARVSDASDSTIAEEENRSQPPSIRVSDAHESVLAEENPEPEAASNRVSQEAQESVGAAEVSQDKALSTRVSDAQESVVAEDNQEPEFASASVSDAQDPVAEKSARSSAAHEVVNDQGQLNSAAPSARQSEAHGNPLKPASTRTSAAYEPPTEDEVVESIEQDEQPLNVDEEAGSSSHNENDDDVFSDHSPRSSVGSISGEDQRKLSHENITKRTSTRSIRMSDFSHYDTDDQEEFIPTVRGTPRPPFRSPSSVKAMQMSSPPASVLGSSRSSRRTPLPTVSRLGSPSAQYSPKKTPPRFRKNTPPLVLLHVTLLPLRWPWGDVLDVAQTDELTEGGKSLREAWRQLQERMGDTTCERGILLPHPQNDFEVLEERLLEALELPLRRRARILECGHYLGPSNDLTLLDDDDSEDEDYYTGSPPRSQSIANKDTHWCSTCHSEIRYDSLGLGKVFRVKVYASNGLIKAGAWEACWKEMERVDVEIEPIVETEVHEELVRLDNEQQRAIELQQEAEQQLNEEAIYDEEQYEEEEQTQLHHNIPPSSPPEIRVTSEPEPPTADEERKLRDEARLREIYGERPPAASESTPAAEAPTSEYVHHRTPPSPAAEAYARREERRQSGTRTDSLPELILEAVKVWMQDGRNVVIALMSVLVLALALRSGNGVGQDAGYQPIVENQPAVVTVTERVQEASTAAQIAAESVVPGAESLTSSATPVAEEHTSASEVADPCSTASSQAYEQAIAEQQAAVSERVVTVVETLTETSYETATVTAQAEPEETLAHAEGGIEVATDAEELRVEESLVEAVEVPTNEDVVDEVVEQPVLEEQEVEEL